MYTLTREQKIENVKEQLSQKIKKAKNLSSEIRSLQEKLIRLETGPAKDTELKKSTSFSTPDPEDWRKHFRSYEEVPPSQRHLYTPEK